MSKIKDYSLIYGPETSRWLTFWIARTFMGFLPFSAVSLLLIWLIYGMSFVSAVGLTIVAVLWPWIMLVIVAKVLMAVFSCYGDHELVLKYAIEGFKTAFIPNGRVFLPNRYGKRR